VCRVEVTDNTHAHAMAVAWFAADLRPSKVTGMIRTAVKIAMAAVGATLVSMLFVGVFVGALHQSVPHRLPIGVAGPAAAARQVGAAIARHSHGAFAVTAYPDAAAAR
jgi:hypothetical protein